MDFKSKDYGQVTVVTVYLTRATLQYAVSFKEFILRQLNEDNKFIVVDLSMCEYLDSTFLGSLVSSLKKTVASGGDLKLVYSNELSSLIFEMTSMNKVFEVHKDLDEAISSFNFKDDESETNGLSWQ
jgi:anti-anti-sigma factor